MNRASHPGETLRWFLYEEGALVETAAEETGLSVEQLRDLIEGRLSVTPEIAGRLAKLYGTTAEMWLKLQANYDEAVRG